MEKSVRLSKLSMEHRILALRPLKNASHPLAETLGG
jgi:hypothetical protein